MRAASCVAAAALAEPQLSGGAMRNFATNRNFKIIWRPELLTTRCLKVLLGVTFCSMLLFLLYIRPAEYFNQSTAPIIDFTWWWRTLRKDVPNAAKKESSRPVKLILVWTDSFGRKDWLISPKQMNCPVSDCDVTFNRTFINDSSALLFHLRDVNLQDLPPVQDPPVPLWVLLNQEAPPNTPNEVVRALRKLVHWTITYRLDSTIYAPYGHILRRNETDVAPDCNPNRNLVCWLVSNCKTSSERESFVEAMSQHIPVQIYGKCGKMKCPMDSKPDCYRWLAQRCKFYLSFENSICKDYATEKLFLALANDMVPVVLGGADYIGMLPAGSYVDAADFAGPRELAWYLDSLGNDTDRYASYFRWKRDFVSQPADYDWLCDLCKKLHEVKDYALPGDLDSWWYEDSKCRSWKEGIRLH